MNRLAALLGILVLTMSSAWAQTTPAAPGATPDATAAGGIADYWWIILLVVVVAGAIWYFSRRRGSV